MAGSTVSVAFVADTRPLNRALDSAQRNLNDTGTEATQAASDVERVFVRMTDRADQAAANFSILGGAVGDVAGGITAFGDELGLSVEAQEAITAGSEKLSAALMFGAGVCDTYTVASELLGKVQIKNTALKIKDKAATIAKTVAEKAAAVASKAMAAAQWLVNAAMTASPIGLVVASLALLVAGFIVAFKKSEAFRKIVDKVFGAIRKIVGKVTDWFKTKVPEAFTKVLDFVRRWNLLSVIARIWEKVKEVAGRFLGWFREAVPTAFDKVLDFVKRWNLVAVLGRVIDGVKKPIDKLVGWVKELPGRIADGAAGLWDGLKNGLKEALNAIIDLWNSIDFGISITVPDWVPKVGGKGFKVDDVFPDIPKLARGGVVRSPTLALIGEAGPEAVVPLDGRGIGDTIVVNVTAPVGASSADIGRELTRHLDAWQRAGGRRIA